jgi:hypothetical protein
VGCCASVHGVMVMPLINLPDPRAPPNELDKRVYGVDCCRHPVLGIPIGHGNGTPGQQARSFLHSIWKAAEVSSVTGETESEREWRLQKIAAELREWWRRLEEWEKTNVVVMPPPLTGYPLSLSPRSEPPPATPRLTAESQAELQKIEKLRAFKRDEEAAAAAVTERQGETTH